MLYTVSTLARSVSVEADSEHAARSLALPQLRALNPAAPIEIRTVRPATDEEIELWRWHHEMLQRDQNDHLADR